MSMKITYKILVTLILVMFTLLPKVNASHFAGADFKYECIGPHTYLVTFSLFRDCGGAQVSNTAYVDFVSTCGQKKKQDLILQNPGGTEVSQLCGASLAQSECSGGPYPGIEEYIYTGIVVLSPKCDYWTMSWADCCRNTASNMVGSSNAFYIPATMYSATDTCNNSPTFNAAPIPYVCQNQIVNYNFGVSEPDGDSIAYKLVNPIDSRNNNANINVPHKPGYTAATPIPSSVLDPATGQLVFTSVDQGSFVVSVEVCEYDYDTKALKGCVIRDIQFEVIACQNSSPTSSNYKNFTGTGILADTTTINVCVGDFISFDLEFPDPNTSDVVDLTTNITSVLPGSNVTITKGNPAKMHVEWITQPGSAPFNVFSVTAKDNSCPIFGLTSASYIVSVTPSTYAGPDKAICTGVEWTKLKASGGTVFQWSVLSGSAIDTVATSAGFNMTCKNCKNPSVSPQTTTTYVVTSDLAGSCRNTDTVIVTAATNYIAASGPDTILCTADSLDLWAEASIGGNYSYKWDNIRRVSDDKIQYPRTFSPITTTYTVTMTSDEGCVKSASNTIKRIPQIPKAKVIADPINICQYGDTSKLLVDLGPNFTKTCTESLYPCDNAGYTADVLLDFNPADGTSGPIKIMSDVEYPAPFGNSSKSVKQQYIYLARELQALNLRAGLITEIGFDVTQINGSAVYNNYSVKMACTQLLSMPGTIFPNISMETVVPPTVVNLTTGWNMLVFDAPYVWDGVSNLLVEICFDNRSQNASKNSFTRTRQFKTATPGNRQFLATLHLPIDTAQACVGTDGVSNSFDRPDTRFKFCYGYDPAAYVYTWWPNKNITDTTIQNPKAYPDTTTTYHVILADTFGVCADTTSFEITVSNFKAGPDTTICAGDTIELKPEVFDECNIAPPIVFWFSSRGPGVISVNGIVPTISVDETTSFYASYTNFCGCKVKDTVTVYVNEIREPNLVFKEPACGLSDGSILIHSDGGLAPYTFTADGGQTFSVDSLFTNLVKGPYTTQYKDAAGCLSPARTDTLLNANTPKIDSILTNTPLCFSSPNGNMEIFTSGGQVPNDYSIDGGLTWSTSNKFTGLAAGTYIVYVREANSCISFPDTVIFTINKKVVFDSAQFTNNDCFQGSTGTIKLFGHGGTPPYTYSIDGGLVYQASDYFDGLKADAYNLLIMDDVGCTTIPFQQIIKDGIEITTNITPVNDTCFNACGGTASVITTGGTAPYSYGWKKGANTIGLNSNNVNGLCAGTDYELTIIDDKNCQAIFPFTITQPDELIASATATNSTCYGLDDGTIIVSVVGGVPPYRYSIDNGVTYQTNSTLTGLPAGKYTITVADNGGKCFGTTTAEIKNPSEIQLTTNVDDVKVCVSGCVELIATATGGQGNTYDYIWNKGLSTDNTQTVCPIKTTLYSVYATDLLGCTSSARLISVSIYDSITVTTGPDLDVCAKESAQLNAIATGGDGLGFNYQWMPVVGISDAFISNPIANPSTNTLYTVKVTDNCGTPAGYDTVRVRVHPDPVMDFYTDDVTSGCEPFNISLINSSTPAQLAEWEITNGNQSFMAHGFQVDLTNLKPGLYDVKLQVTTPDGCVRDTTKTDFFDVYAKPTALYSMNPNQTTVYNTAVQFEDESIGSVTAWEWDFAGVGSSTNQNPLFKFPADTGTFPITLKISTDKLCADEVTELLRIGAEFNFFVPNSFTPNGDNHNDVFEPGGLGLDKSQYSLHIYDRWGGLVFESEDLTQGWDGRHQGTSKMCQNGIYVWKIIVHDYSDKPSAHDYTGTVNLIR